MFTEDQERVLQEKLDAMSAKILEQFNNGLSGLAKRLTADELPKAISGQISPFQQQFNSFQEALNKLQPFDEAKVAQIVRAQFDSLLEELAEEEEKASLSSEKGGKGNSSANNPAIAELQRQMEDLTKQYSSQLEQMKLQVEAARKAAETERQTRERLAEEARMQKLDDSILDALRGKVRSGTERELLTLMKASGILEEDKEKNMFVIQVDDEFGLKTTKPAVEVLDSVIANRWSHYQDRRPGTGTGATPPTQGGYTPGNSNLKYARVQGDRITLDDRVLEEAAREGKLDDLLKELANISS